MKINTSIRTLKGVYGLFKEAGMAGLLTGDANDVSAADVMDKLIAGGLMVEAMKQITGSDKYEDDKKIETDWEDVPYGVINEVLVDFFAGIGSVSALARG